MGHFTGSGLGFAAILGALTGCSGEEPSFAAEDAGAAGGAGGSVAGTGATAGASGAGGVQPLSCAGAWGATPRVVLRTAAEVRLGSPTLSPDELELYYAWSEPITRIWSIRRSVRSSKTAEFPDGAVVPELDEACPTAEYNRNLDLSSDGLRAYIGCYPDTTPTVGPLRIARRTAIGAPWVLDPTTTPNVGPSVAISHDELALYASSTSRPGPPLVYTRTSTSAVFGDGVPVPGFEAVNIEALDPSPDGASILGYLERGVAVATGTPRGPFGPTTTLIPGTPEQVIGSPEHSQNCRSLYYIRVADVTPPSVYSIEVRER